MEELTSIILHDLKGQGLPLLLVFAALIYFYRGNATLITSFGQERNARLDAMDAHIRALEAKSLECEEDRERLWERLLEHTAKQ